MSYKLEIIFDNERPRYTQERLAFLQQEFAGLQEIAHSTLYVIVGCERDDLLSEREKTILSRWMEQKVILRFRCKQLHRS